MSVKERPLIFTGARAVANVEGRKTQTRRIVKPQPPPGSERCWVEHPHGKPMACYRSFPEGGSARTGLCECPYGVPGDRFWQRERHAIVRRWASQDPARPFFNWLGNTPKERPEGWDVIYRPDGRYAGCTRETLPFTWRPAMFMPRWASRFVAEITDVRVERLQDISEEDAKAEGVEASEAVEASDGQPCYTEPFRNVWDSLHGIDNPAAWDSNPWVWVLTYRSLES